MKIALAPIALRAYRSRPDSETYKNDIMTMLRRVKACGYDGIEMGTPVGFSKEEYKDFMDEIGLTPVSGSGVRFPEFVTADFKKQIEDCNYLGIKNIMVGSMPNYAYGNPAEHKKFIAALNRAGKILWEEGGIHLSFHNHAIDFSKSEGIPVIQRIMENTDPRYVFFEPDTHWLQAGGGHVISWLKKLKGRIYIVHFKDYGIDPYSDHTFLECTHKLFMEIGLGSLNWPGIVAECLDQGIEWCAVEQDQTQRPPYESLKISADYLRGMGLGA